MVKRYRYKITSTTGRSYYSTTTTSPSEMQKWKKGFNKYAKTKGKIAKIENKPLVKRKVNRRPTLYGGWRI